MWTCHCASIPRACGHAWPFSISASLEPDILLIDEHVGAGDAGFIDKIRSRIEAVIDGSSIFVLASHDEGLLQRFCRKRVTLESGSIVSIQ